MPRFLSLILAALTVAGAPIFAAEPAATGHHDHGPVLGALSLDVYPSDQALHLLVAETRAGEPRPALLYRRSDDGGQAWSQPVAVDAGLPGAHNPHRGADPQIASAGQRLVAVWMSKGTGYFDSGPMVTALSSDGGKTWQPGPNPADDQSTGGHGFIDIAADAAGTFYLTWLDSRDGKQGLRFSRSTDGGKSWSPNQTLKAGSCECCSNAVAVGRDGAIGILFRDGSPRDMNLTLSTDGGAQWAPPRPVGNFGWQFNGCPHVGGGLAFSPSALHAVVWTGLSDRSGVHYLSSPDRGQTWSKLHRLGSSAASHPDIATSPDNQHIAAVWDEHTAEGPAIWCARSKDGGVTWSVPTQISKTGASATHPRVVATGSGFRAFWTVSIGDNPATWVSAPLP